MKYNELNINQKINLKSRMVNTDLRIVKAEFLNTAMIYVDQPYYLWVLWATSSSKYMFTIKF